MDNKSTSPIGKFCWVDLETPDVKAAKGFYSEILNWNYNEMKSPDGKSYFVIENNGRGIGGITEGKTPHWTGYVFVENVDEYTVKAKSLGATILEQPFDVGNMGRMSTLKDPTGAQFCLWQTKTQSENNDVGMHNGLGNFCWPELATKDIKTAKKFYCDLFGWTVDEKTPVKDYTLFYKDGAMTGGMLPIAKDWSAMEPQWFMYFSVDDCTTRTKQATNMKATLGVGPKDIPNVGRFSILKDPQGAHTAILQLLPMGVDSANEKKK